MALWQIPEGDFVPQWDIFQQPHFVRFAPLEAMNGHFLTRFQIGNGYRHVIGALVRQCPVRHSILLCFPQDFISKILRGQRVRITR